MDHTTTKITSTPSSVFTVTSTTENKPAPTKTISTHNETISTSTMTTSTFVETTSIPISYEIRNPVRLPPDAGLDVLSDDETQHDPLADTIPTTLLTVHEVSRQFWYHEHVTQTIYVMYSLYFQDISSSDCCEYITAEEGEQSPLKKVSVVAQ